MDTEQSARYRWAAAVCSGRRVLDVGCGPDGETGLLGGWGAASITAVVRSDAAAQLARPALGDEVRCEVAQPGALPFADDTFDVVIAFGVLDRDADPAALLDELARVLAPGGRLLASCSSAGTPVVELVRQRWTISISEQHTVMASAVGDPAAGDAAIGPLPEPAQDGGCTTILLDAGTTVETGRGVVAFGALAPVAGWLKEGERAAAALAATGKELAELRRHDQRATDVRRQLIDAEQRVAGLAVAEAERDDARRDLREARERLQQAEEALARTAGELAGLHASRSWRLTAWMRRVQRRRRGA